LHRSGEYILDGGERKGCVFKVEVQWRRSLKGTLKGKKSCRKTPRETLSGGVGDSILVCGSTFSLIRGHQLKKK